MTISAQAAVRNISPDKGEPSDKSKDKEVPEEEFSALLRTTQVKEEERRKGFFAMLVKEKEETRRESKETETLHENLSLQQKQELGLIGGGPCMSSVGGIDAHLPPTAPACMAATLPPDIEAAFEKMASCMLVMTSSNETQTTVYLDHPRFASSALFGTQITIREFSSAPKIFNVEIISNPLAVATIDASKNDLLAAFQNGKFNFSIHRFETQIAQNDDRPVLHRKEGDDREQKEQNSGRE